MLLFFFSLHELWRVCNMLPVGEFWLSFRPEAFRNTTIMDIMTNYGFNLRVEITVILHMSEDGVNLSRYDIILLVVVFSPPQLFSRHCTINQNKTLVFAPLTPTTCVRTGRFDVVERWTSESWLFFQVSLTTRKHRISYFSQW